MTTTIDALMKLDKKEMGKLSKDVIIGILCDRKWEYTNKAEQIKTLTDKLDLQAKEEHHVKALLKGYLGIEETGADSYYNFDQHVKGMSLAELVGKTLVHKASN